MSKINRFIRDNQLPNCTVKLRWNTLPDSEPERSEPPQYQGGGCSWFLCSTVTKYFLVGTFASHPRGYQQNPQHPVLRGQNHCPHCLCAPCVIAQPPDFLRGSSSPHPANDEKRHRLYRLFWRSLKDLGLWRDEEYLARKEIRTSRDDKRDIIPKCVITVSSLSKYCKCYIPTSYVLCRKLDQDIRAMTAIIMTTCQHLKQKQPLNPKQSFPQWTDCCHCVCVCVCVCVTTVHTAKETMV